MMTVDNSRRRKIRSFVRREGRLTPAQQRGLDDSWAEMGLNPADGVLDCAQAFGREAPTVLEIGFGMGGSLLEMCQASPGKDFIGVEVHRPGVGAFLHQAKTLALTNVRVYCHDAVEILNENIIENSVDRIQVFFPDPWHKKRHHKRRLIQPEFVALLTRKLKPGGVLHLATDWQPYAEHMMAVLSANASLANCAGEQAYSPKPFDRPLTKYEQRGQRLGHGVWDLLFTKNSA
jgi:tRNA (guanine-N7-)-methyltransferase